MTTEDAVKSAIDGHYKMTGRAIGKKELKGDAELILESGIPPVDFNRAIGTLKRAKRIRETKPNYYAPCGVQVNNGPFPKAKDIVPTPKRKKVCSVRKA